MRTIIVIPARFASTRLPGKPLLPICGKPMIQHVYERALQVEGIDAVIVATDDSRIMSAITSFGGMACMTSVDCASGSDRLLEVAKQEPADIYVNIQGDEPLLDPDTITSLVRTMQADQSIQVGTLCHPLVAAKVSNPNVVKVVLKDNGDALYFSRAAIPFDRDKQDCAQCYAHIGVYAYRAEALQTFGSLVVSSLEKTEQLEQLRLLQSGVDIRVVKTDSYACGVDTPEDLATVRLLLGDTTSPSAPPPPSITEILSKIKLIITDVDGVLTDGSLYYDAQGEAIKCFNVRDGLGIRLLQKAGVQVAVLSGRESKALQSRMRDLGITIFETGQLAKFEACKRLMEKAACCAEETLFVGDDLPDAVAFKACALGVAVGDAADFVKNQAGLILKNKGGCGAFRELAETILLAQNRTDLLEPEQDLPLKKMSDIC